MPRKSAKTSSQRQQEYISRLRENGGSVFKVTLGPEVTRKLETLQKAFPDISKSRLVELSLEGMFDKVEPVLRKQYPDLLENS